MSPEALECTPEEDDEAIPGVAGLAAECGVGGGFPGLDVAHDEAASFPLAWLRRIPSRRHAARVQRNLPRGWSPRVKTRANAPGDRDSVVTPFATVWRKLGKHGAIR